MINIFDEEKYALDVLNEGFMSKKQGLELFILAKYYRFKHNKSKSECKKLLKEFCEKQVADYEHSELYRKVNSTIDQAYDKDAILLEIKHIEFNQYELDYINSLNISSNCKQVLFGLWCCNKLNIKANQSDKWVNITYSELKKFCNLSNGNMFKIMNELYVNGLIFISDKCALCLTFLDMYNNYVSEKDISLSPLYYIYDFETCGLWWQKQNGNKKIIVCAECEKLTVRSSNRQKYCKNCAKQKELEKYERYNQKREL